MELSYKENQKKSLFKIVKSFFLDENKLTKSQRTDPDYRLKDLVRIYNLNRPLVCSRCHHCR